MTHADKFFLRNNRYMRAVFMIACLTAGQNVSWAIDVNTLPTGGQITAGSGQISQAGNSLTVTQNSNKLIANWDSFNIGQNASVRFIQPSASSAALNRILDQNPSQILGKLQANGQVFLLNPAGIIFGQGSQINVGALVASSMNMTDENFLSGNYRFTANGTSGEVSNLGMISTTEGGIVALIGSRVKNEGNITTPQGTSLLAAGEDVTLDFAGDGLIIYSIDQGAFDALASNQGLIKADGGMVVMTAKAANEMTTAVVNNEGVIEAKTLESREGKILLLSDMKHGETIVSGKLDASALDSGDGGFVETSAAKVTVKDDARVYTSSPSGEGGLWLIDPQDFTIAAAGGDISGATIATNLQSGDITILNSTGGAAGNGDIFINDDIITSADLGATRTLTFKAERDIVMQDGKSIDATQGGNTKALNVVFWADTDANGGNIVVGSTGSSNITTNGGHLWMGGGSGSTTWNGLTVGDGSAWGVGSNGITFNNGAINTGAGNISLSGKSNTRGINFGGSAQIITTSGNVDVSATSTSDIGLMVQGADITTGTGDITLTGSGNVGAGGVHIENGTQITSTSGAITIDGANSSASGYGILINTSTTTFGGVGSSSAILLKADSIAIYDGRFQSSNTLTLENKNAGTAITVGSNPSVNTFKLSAANFSTHFVDGFSSITIGSATAGGITVGGATTFNDSTTLQSNSTIAINGAISANENLSLISNGAISQSQALAVTGTTSITAGSGNNVTLDNASNNFADAVSIVSGNDVSLRDADAIKLGASTISGDLTVQSSGAVTQSGSLAVTGTTTITAGAANNISLDDTGNDFTGEFSVVSGAAVSVKDANSITLGDINMSGDLTAEALSGNLLLDGAIVKNSGADATATLKATGYVTLADSTYIGSSSTAAADGITSSITSSNNKLNLVINPRSGGGLGSFWLPKGSSIQTNGGDITIGGGAGASSAAIGVNTVSYEWNSLLRGIAINGTLNAQGGDITMIGQGSTDAGVTAARGVHIGGTVSTSGTGSISITGTAKGASAGIGIDDSTGVGGPGSITAENGNITLIANKDTGAAFQLYSSTSQIQTSGSGNLSLTSDGSFLGNGIFDIGGTTTLTAGAGNDLSLTNSSNDFTGAVSVVSSNNFDLVDSNALTLGAVSSLGTIDVATLTGDLTLTGAISTSSTAADAATLNAGKNTAAGTATGGNIIVSGGSVSVGSGGRATLYSGSISDSTGLTTLVGSGSGNFRYNSDESASNFTTALGSGNHAIYREQPTVTVTAANHAKTYDGLAYSGGNGASYSGFVNGDTSASLGGSLSYGGSSQGATNAGSYTITASGYTDGLGYALSYADGTLTVNKALLGVTAKNDSKVYDGLAYSGGNGVTYSGFVNGETSSVLGGTLAYGGSSQGAVNTGSYVITPSGLTSSNYNLSFANGSLTITAAAPVATTPSVDLVKILSSPLAPQVRVNGTRGKASESSARDSTPDVGPGSGSMQVQQRPMGEIIVDLTGYRDDKAL